MSGKPKGSLYRGVRRVVPGESITVWHINVGLRPEEEVLPALQDSIDHSKKFLRLHGPGASRRVPQPVPAHLFAQLRFLKVGLKACRDVVGPVSIHQADGMGIPGNSRGIAYRCCL